MAYLLQRLTVQSRYSPLPLYLLREGLELSMVRLPIPRRTSREILILGVEEKPEGVRNDEDINYD